MWDYPIINIYSNMLIKFSNITLFAFLLWTMIDSASSVFNIINIIIKPTSPSVHKHYRRLDTFILPYKTIVI